MTILQETQKKYGDNDPEEKVKVLFKEIEGTFKDIDYGKT
jgi:hypothetical protein